jgi:hypothetical protein
MRELATSLRHPTMTETDGRLRIEGELVFGASPPSQSALEALAGGSFAEARGMSGDASAGVNLTLQPETLYPSALTITSSINSSDWARPAPSIGNPGLSPSPVRQIRTEISVSDFDDPSITVVPPE